MSFFWSCIKPHRNYFLLLTIAPIITAFVPLFSNYVIKEIVDVFTSETTHGYEALGFALALFFGSLLAIHGAYRIGQFGEWNSVPYIKGRIVQEGTHEQLLQRGGLYKDLWEAQVVV